MTVIIIAVVVGAFAVAWCIRQAQRETMRAIESLSNQSKKEIEVALLAVQESLDEALEAIYCNTLSPTESEQLNGPPRHEIDWTERARLRQETLKNLGFEKKWPAP